MTQNNDDLKKPMGLRHRILGAVLLISLGVIFLPLFFEYVPQDIYLPKLVKAPVAPSLPASHVAPQAWVIKIHETTDSNERLIKQLKAAGYPAYAVQVGTQTEVFVGPETDHNTIATWVAALQKKNFQAEVVAYDPLVSTTE